MGWGDAFDKLMEMRDRHRITIRVGNSLAEAVVRAMETAAIAASICRDASHPRYRGNAAPNSPKPRFRKGRR